MKHRFLLFSISFLAWGFVTTRHLSGKCFCPQYGQLNCPACCANNPSVVVGCLNSLSFFARSGVTPDQSRASNSAFHSFIISLIVQNSASEVNLRLSNSMISFGIFAFNTGTNKLPYNSDSIPNASKLLRFVSTLS